MMRPSPRSDAEWARNTENRVRRLESGVAAVRIGQWVLADHNGELVAVSLDGRSYTLSSPAVQTTPVIGGSDATTTTAFTRVVTITLRGGITGGTFTLTVEGATTDPIPYNSPASLLLTMLAGLPNYSAEDFVVTGSDGGPWTVAFTGVSITGDAEGLDWFLFEAQVQIT